MSSRIPNWITFAAIALLIADACAPGPTPDRTPIPVQSGTGKMAFASDRDGDFDIYLMNTDGTRPINLTDNTANDLELAWSPDGTQIAFTSNRDGNFEIYTIKADGTGAMRLTDDPGIDGMPSWSPMARTLHLRATAMATLKYM
ncbi:MAG TPA: hypothetical protein VJ793_02430 [Anaerolineae bacterium]|nr:hypothetical protein [Anaerolineae bacterium]